MIVSVENIRSELNYTRLMDQCGLRRKALNFWSFSDRLHSAYLKYSHVDGVWLDYNRLENS